MMKLVWIALGGSLGALLRHGLSVLANRLLPPAFPWDTLAANLLGCFLIGLLWVLATEYSLSQEARVFVFTGGLGALTTFSTYGLESLMLLREGRLWAGLGNVLLSNVFGLVLVALGVWGNPSPRWARRPRSGELKGSRYPEGTVPVASSESFCCPDVAPAAPRHP